MSGEGGRQKGARAREFPSFELFCTEAFQFDYEAPFHRAWMPRAAQNESEPLAGRLSSSLPVPALWGQPGGGSGTTRVGEPCMPFSLPPRCLVGLRGKWEKRRSSGLWLSGRGRGTDAVRFGMVREGVVSCAKGRVTSSDRTHLSLPFKPFKIVPLTRKEGRNVGV